MKNEQFERPKLTAETILGENLKKERSVRSACKGNENKGVSLSLQLVPYFERMVWGNPPPKALVSQSQLADMDLGTSSLLSTARDLGDSCSHPLFL